ncbi:hypothetical protein ACFS32_02575 [Novosphingobium pokkalii]|uniref:hypothetical protein n=1 Tax=Novosphingobium pokkalii TaxID=1770194 RepID=UPI00362859C5
MMPPDSHGVVIVPAQARHVGFLARRMRAIDQIECRAMGREPKAALRHGLMASTRCWTALVDGQPHAMFGVVVESALTGRGCPGFWAPTRCGAMGARCCVLARRSWRKCTIQAPCWPT